MMLTKEKRQTGGLDVFRMVAAFFVVAIHTGPFQSVSSVAEQYITYGVCRIAVPFFFMVTGFFVLSHPEKIRREVYHLLMLYGFSIFIYLPFQIYAGNLPKGFIGACRQIIFDGTFYHLWYLPAVILGLWVSGQLVQRFGLQKAGIVAAVLYLAGIFGDSYYGAITQIKPLKMLYDVLFAISSYTRNGIFFAPVFLILGAALASNETIVTKAGSVFGFLLSLTAMQAEIYLTTGMNWQRHNSMYLFLPLVVFFLFEGLRYLPIRPHPQCRKVAMWVYLLHPFSIIGVRAVAGVLGKKQWLTEQRLLFYVLVCISAAIAAVIAAQFYIKIGKGVLRWKIWKKAEHGLN